MITTGTAQRHHRRNVLAACVALGMTSVLGGAQGHGAARRTNTLWVWSKLPPQKLMAVASAQRVGALLVWVAPGFSAESSIVDWLGELQTAAKAEGVRIDALGGDPSWAREPQRAAAWSLEAGQSGSFARLHLDIEAYSLPEWTTDSAELLDGTLEALKQAADGRLPVDVDVPYWLQSFSASDGRDGLTAVCDVADSITVMAYQNESSAIERVARPAVDAGARRGIPVWIGVNLRRPVNDAPSSSLWGADAQTITRTLATVAAIPGIAGIALHDADAMAALRMG